MARVEIEREKYHKSPEANCLRRGFDLGQMILKQLGPENSSRIGLLHDLTMLTILSNGELRMCGSNLFAGLGYLIVNRQPEIRMMGETLAGFPAPVFGHAAQLFKDAVAKPRADFDFILKGTSLTSAGRRLKELGNLPWDFTVSASTGIQVLETGGQNWSASIIDGSGFLYWRNPGVGSNFDTVNSPVVSYGGRLLVQTDTHFWQQLGNPQVARMTNWENLRHAAQTKYPMLAQIVITRMMRQTETMKMPNGGVLELGIGAKSFEEIEWYFKVLGSIDDSIFSENSGDPFSGFAQREVIVAGRNRHTLLAF